MVVSPRIRGFFFVDKIQVLRLINGIEFSIPTAQLVRYPGKSPAVTLLLSGMRDYNDIWQLSRQIFTYNEQMTENKSLSDIREAVVNAQRLLFLGFHFHQQNMDLLQTAAAGGRLAVWATAIERASPELEIIRNQAQQMLKAERQSNIQLLGLGCRELLNQFGTTLLR